MVEVFGRCIWALALACMLQEINWMSAFAGVVTWGDITFGGKITFDMFKQLHTGVDTICSTGGAFAARKIDGTVVTWGHSYWGGNSSSVADQLSSVDALYSTKSDQMSMYADPNNSGGAFAARKTDGSVVTWGGSPQDFLHGGGNSSSVADQLRDVETIYSNSYAFAAKKTDGTVVTWGHHDWGGDSSSVVSQLVNVDTIYSTKYAFAAKRTDGTVVTWGDVFFQGGNSVASQLTDVVTIYTTHYAFAAKKRDFSVVIWGWPRSTLGYIYNVSTIYSNSVSFAAKKTDGSVVTWGVLDREGSGGDSSSVSDRLVHVDTICSTESAFAAKRSDGTVVTWGNSEYGGDSSSVAGQLFSVETIYSTWNGAFAAKRTDGTVVTWGSSAYGGDSSAVAGRLTDVETIYSTGGAFAAVRKDGTLVTWGNSEYGGDSSSVRAILLADNQIATIYSTSKAFAAVFKNACSGAYIELNDDWSSSCIPCPQGYFSNTSGVPECMLCEAGRFAPSAGMSACLDCPVGHFCSPTSAHLSGIPCPAGTYQPGQSLPNSVSSCLPCPEGAYSDEGAEACHVSRDVEALLMAAIFLGLILMTAMFAVVMKCRHSIEGADYAALFTPTLALFDVSSDALFLADLVVAEGWTLAAWLSLASLSLSTAVVMVVVVWLLQREIKRNADFSDWFAANQATSVLAALLSMTNAEVLEVLGCKVGGLAALSAPWHSDSAALLSVFSLSSTLLEDLPQLCIQTAVSASGGLTTVRVVSLAATAVMIGKGLLTRGFTFLIHKYQSTSVISRPGIKRDLPAYTEKEEREIAELVSDIAAKDHVLYLLDNEITELKQLLSGYQELYNVDKQINELRQQLSGFHAATSPNTGLLSLEARSHDLPTADLLSSSMSSSIPHHSNPDQDESVHADVSLLASPSVSDSASRFPLSRSPMSPSTAHMHADSTREKNAFSPHGDRQSFTSARFPKDPEPHTMTVGAEDGRPVPQLRHALSVNLISERGIPPEREGFLRTKTLDSEKLVSALYPHSPDVRRRAPARRDRGL
eukprot:g4671.t1